VDFPQPEGPSSDRNSPSATSRDISWSATVRLEKTFPTWRSETSGAPPPPCGEELGDGLPPWNCRLEDPSPSRWAPP